MVLGAVLTVLTAVLALSLLCFVFMVFSVPARPLALALRLCGLFSQKVWWPCSFAARKWALCFCQGHGKTGGQLLVHKYCRFLKSVVRLLGQLCS